MKKLLLSAFFMVSSNYSAAANQAFMIDGICLEGLHRVKEGRVLGQLPPIEDCPFTEELGQEILHKLYQGGQFSSIALLRSGNDLVIRCEENPVIAELKCADVKLCPQEMLDEMAKRAGIGPGDPVNRFVLRHIENQLLQQAQQKGHYAATVQITQIPLSKNRVRLKVLCRLGPMARIHQVMLVGNKKFTTPELLQNCGTSASSWNPLSANRLDTYQLQQDRDRLKNFYLSRGYLGIEISPALIELNPEKTGVYVTLNLQEGRPYTLSALAVVCKDRALEADLLTVKHGLEVGSIFNSLKVVEYEQALKKALQAKGYYFAEVTHQKRLDHAGHAVALSFICSQKQRCYVRHIQFSKVAATQEHVLRRSLRMVEGSIYSGAALEEAGRHLSNLGYLAVVNTRVHKVPGHENLVDVQFIGNPVLSRNNLTGNVSISESLSSAEADVGLFLDNLAGLGIQASGNVSLKQGHLQLAGRLADPCFFSQKVGGDASLEYSKSLDTVDWIKRNLWWGRADGTKTTADAAETYLPIHGRRYGLDQFSFGAGLRFKLFSNIACKVKPIVLKYLSIIYPTNLINYNPLKTMEETSTRPYVTLAQQLYCPTASFDYSTLDTSLYPKSGWFVSAEAEGFFRLSDATVSGFTQSPGCKLQGEVNYCIGLGREKKWVVRFGLDLGRVFVQGDGPPPFYQAFDAVEVRGFTQGTVGPKACYREALSGELSPEEEASKKKYRVRYTQAPVGGNEFYHFLVELRGQLPFLTHAGSRVGLFCEAGSMRSIGWDQEELVSQCFDPEGNPHKPGPKGDPGRHFPRVSAGIFGSFLSPFGLVRVALGAPLWREDADQCFALHISIAGGSRSKHIIW